MGDMRINYDFVLFVIDYLNIFYAELLLDAFYN